jgi:4-alpha-glucanotransferase
MPSKPATILHEVAPMGNGQSLSKPPTLRKTRSAGILLHVTSLPGKYGIGDFGPAAHAFVESLARAKQTWWQVLPLTPPADGSNPYNSFSAFAGNPNLVSPELLLRDGLLRRSDLSAQGFPEGKVGYPRVNDFRSEILRRAWERFAGGAVGSLRGEFEQFCHDQSAWLDDFALFMALKEMNENKPWTEWDRSIVRRNKSALDAARCELAEHVQRHQFVQFLFFRQLNDLRRRAHELGVKLFGDMPIFVSGDSADVWANPHLFQLDKDGHAKVVSGCPPDYFSETGQRWGNPHYDWPAMTRDAFAWWVARLRNTFAQVDMIRIDHFRGFEAYWQIKAQHPTAKDGRWVKAPGTELFHTLRRELGSLPLVAEDLGLITPEVVALRESFGLPGMKVLQFAFGGAPDDPFLPHNYERNTVAYTGTHDNDTTVGWFKSLQSEERRRVERYVPGSGRNVAWELIRLAWSSVADTAIAPLQDVLSLGPDARMNLPGTAAGNWGWRLKPGMLKNQLLDRLGEMTETYGRAPKVTRA